MNLFIRLLYALSPMLVLTNIECFAGQATSNGGEFYAYSDLFF